MAERYDVFISYHSKKPVGEWVREFFAQELKSWLDQQFPDRPAQVFYDQTSIPLGDEFNRRLLSAIGSSRVFVPILSPSYFSQSPWCVWEWTCFRAWRPDAVMPVLYYNRQALPADVQPIEMEDFTSLNDTFPAWRKSVKYARFQKRVRVFAEQVADRIRAVPLPADGVFAPGFVPPDMPLPIAPPLLPVIPQHRMAA